MNTILDSDLDLQILAFQCKMRGSKPSLDRVSIGQDQDVLVAKILTVFTIFTKCSGSEYVLDIPESNTKARITIDNGMILVKWVLDLNSF